MCFDYLIQIVLRNKKVDTVLVIDYIDNSDSY